MCVFSAGLLAGPGFSHRESGGRSVLCEWVGTPGYAPRSMGAVETLLAAWRASPDADTTRALCLALAGSPDASLVMEVAALAEQRYPLDVEVHLCVARMFAGHQAWERAQRALVGAGRAAPERADVFEQLGFVLLRRGDAVRAEQALSRALRIDPDRSETRALYDHAAALITLQTTSGADSVVVAFDRSFPSLSSWPPALSLESDAPSSVASRQSFRAALVQSEAGADAGGFPSEPDKARALMSWLGVHRSMNSVEAQWQGVLPHRIRFGWLLPYAIGVTLLLGLGAHTYARVTRAADQRAAEESQKLASSLVIEGTRTRLNQARVAVKNAFRRASEDPRTQRVWLETLVVGGLESGGEPKGLSDALRRAKASGLLPNQMAFAKVAALVFEGDSGAAVAELPLTDSLAVDDAFYQLVAGVALERAGYPLSAIGRFERALQLSPKFNLAAILLARAAAFQLGSEAAQRVIERHIDDSTVRRAFRELNAVLDGDSRGRPGSAWGAKELELLPRAVRGIPHLVEAWVAVRAGERMRAAEAIGVALPWLDSPALLVWLGFAALQGEQWGLAQRAADLARWTAVDYPGVRVLDARIALFRGQLAQALLHVADLDPKAPEVAAVVAVVAYERLDRELLASQMLALRTRPDYSVLVAGEQLISGSTLARRRAGTFAQRSPGLLWSRVVAIDEAVQSGHLESVDSLFADSDLSIPALAVRRARVARERGDIDGALNWSKVALEGGEHTPRAVLERASALALGGEKAAAQATLGDLMVASPLRQWLEVYVEIVTGHLGAGRELAHRLPLPPARSAGEVQRLALSMLKATGDRRSKTLRIRLAE